MVMMWSGSIATIPSGWLLCDGTNSTPDLRNRFIIGANADDAGVAKTNITGSPTQTGGSKDAIVVSHTHTINDPGHTHVTNTSGPDQRDGGPFNYTANWTPGSVSGSSTTGISINSTGSSGTNANLVPYYALAFIMKA
jgi:microcystin-dependent protein